MRGKPWPLDLDSYRGYEIKPRRHRARVTLVAEAGARFGSRSVAVISLRTICVCISDWAAKRKSTALGFVGRAALWKKSKTLQPTNFDS